MSIEVHVTLERSAKGKWSATFQGPSQGGAMKVSKTLKDCLKYLTKALLREFPDAEPTIPTNPIPHPELLP